MCTIFSALKRQKTRAGASKSVSILISACQVLPKRSWLLPAKDAESAEPPTPMKPATRRELAASANWNDRLKYPIWMTETAKKLSKIIETCLSRAPDARLVIQ